MIIPSPFFSTGKSSCEGCHTWNDPRRKLYPHHAEFWPEDLPEHVSFEREARKLRQQKQRAWARSFFRFRWLGAVAAFARAPYWPRLMPEDPMERRTECKMTEHNQNGDHSDNH